MGKAVVLAFALALGACADNSYQPPPQYGQPDCRLYEGRLTPPECYYYNPKEDPNLPPPPGDVNVRGYYRKDGTYVQPHTRTRPDGNPYNNKSYRGGRGK